ncbi:MAG: hypothetical protein WHS88_07945 [Anaerohalosphaeraceae bacterium]
MDEFRREELDLLLYQMLENEASDEQIAHLNKLLSENAEALRYSMDFYLVASALRKSNVIPSASLGTVNEIDEQFHLLKLFAEEERVAPSIELPEEDEEPAARPVPKTVYRPDRQKAALWALTASMAALVIFFASVKFLPEREPVAFVAEAVEPRWQNGEEGLKIQDLLYNTDTPRILRSGLIEVEFYSGARVVIEGPAEFVCKSDNMLSLSYGRVYARVPDYASGFTVLANGMRIVDLGTEFGVQANVDCSVELHVTKGRTSLVTGRGEQDVHSVEAGQARRVRDGGGTVEEISLKETHFAQRIDTRTQMVWKGQRTLNLADMVGGGNGLGTGCLECGIDPATARGMRMDEYYYWRFPEADNRYRTVDWHPFIDGIFVPNSARGRQIVSSRGDIFEECPVTNSRYYVSIVNGTEQTFGGGGPGLALNGVYYGNAASPAIFLHANQGITFDLEAIRQALKGAAILRFDSVGGISATAPEYGLADLYVLVDGKVRFYQPAVQKSQFCRISVELRPQDRFLTLAATTHPGKQVPAGFNEEHGDWCLFGAPVLVLEP